MHRFLQRCVLVVFLASLGGMETICPPTALALTSHGVEFADTFTSNGRLLPLRHAALLRYLGLIKVYVAALYLPAEVKAEEVLTDVPKRLEIAYLVAIGRDDFAESAEEMLQRNLTPVQFAELRGRIARLHQAYRDVQEGDRYALSYVPGQGTELAFNGTTLVRIEGADFAAAYFGIWLGREPIDEQLKAELLHGR